MSPTAHRAVATAPFDFAALEGRLLSLRAEIDAVLAELAGCKEAVALAEPQADAAGDIAGTQQAPAAATQIIAEVAAADTAADDTAAADEPAAPAPALQASPEADSSRAAPIASIDAEPAASLPEAIAAPAAEAASADTPIAPQSAIEAVATEAAPAADPVPTCKAEPAAPAAAAAQAAPAPAPVLAFEPRPRAQTEACLPPARTRGRGVTRVAASILGLLVAGTALVAADRAAIGSVHALPWISQLPSYMPVAQPPAATWSIFGQTQSGDPALHPGVSAEDALQQRDRAAWPPTP